MSIRSNTDPRAMNRRIRIERQVQTQDGTTGRPTITWQLVIECWARVDAQKVGARIAEPILTGEKTQVETLTIWVRADIVTRFSVNTSMRIVWTTLGTAKAYDIRDVLNQQLDGRLMPLIVEGGKGDGR
jgi:head-tail adaptor